MLGEHLLGALHKIPQIIILSVRKWRLEINNEFLQTFIVTIRNYFISDLPNRHHPYPMSNVIAFNAKNYPESYMYVYQI